MLRCVSDESERRPVSYYHRNSTEVVAFLTATIFLPRLYSMGVAVDPSSSSEKTVSSIWTRSLWPWFRI